TRFGDAEIAVVGAGPAGAVAARALARRGRKVVLLDGSTRREKPCGGGIPDRGVRAFRELLAGVARPGGGRAGVGAARRAGGAGGRREPLAIFARADLDESLRTRAREAGAALERARVVAIEPRDGGFSLATSRGALDASYVVAADGAASATAWRLAELGALP